MRLRQRWESYKEHLRFKYGPKLASWLVNASTLPARSYLRKHGAIGILVDNTVLQHGITHETAWISTGPKMWGPHEIETGYSARVPVHPPDADTREYRSIQFLPGIAHLARTGRIKLYTSAELQYEQFRQPAGRYRGYGSFDYNVFNRVHFEHLKRNYRGSIIWNCHGNQDHAADQRERLEQAKENADYEALAKALGQRNSQDAFHIHTAEENGFHCFLTMDFKLIRTMEGAANAKGVRNLSTKVLTPEALGKLFNLIPIPPQLLSYNDVSWFVRADLSMPEGKRRPLRSYRRSRQERDGGTTDGAGQE